MKNSLKLLLTLGATAVAVAVSSEPVLARGGAAANIMNSPGYQRRLQESRQQLSQPPCNRRPPFGASGGIGVTVSLRAYRPRLQDRHFSDASNFRSAPSPFSHARLQTFKLSLSQSARRC